MDSPKGGPLTTFIMMLPLIVVPTIAMFKPADSSGLVSSLLSAASGDRAAESQPEPAGDDDVFAAADEEFEALFGESSAPPADQFGTEDSSALLQEAVGNPSNEPFSSDFEPPPQSPAQLAPPAVSQGQNTDAATQQLLNQLSQAGAARTLWFSPGESTYGFAAFFTVGPGIVSYRFEAIAGSRAAAVQDVLRQFQTWQKAQRK